MKENFDHTRLQARTIEKLVRINDVVEEYEAMGLVLSVRQLYYQAVSRGFIENNADEYNGFANLVRDGRMNGIIDWDMIEDRSRVPHKGFGVTGVPGFINTMIGIYKRKRWEGQPEYIELAIEKDAIREIVAPFCDEYGLTLMVTRGYPSVTMVYDCRNRMLNQNRPCRIIYAGDHDCTGVDIDRSFEETLNKMGARVTFERIALNLDQTDGLYPNPTKEGDTRCKKYVEKYGKVGWEVDALPPERLSEIFQSSIKNHLDSKIYQDVLNQEKEDLEKLKCLT